MGTGDPNICWSLAKIPTETLREVIPSLATCKGEIKADCPITVALVVPLMHVKHFCGPQVGWEALL